MQFIGHYKAILQSKMLLAQNTLIGQIQTNQFVCTVYAVD